MWRGFWFSLSTSFCFCHTFFVYSKQYFCTDCWTNQTLFDHIKRVCLFVCFISSLTWVTHSVINTNKPLFFHEAQSDNSWMVLDSFASVLSQIMKFYWIPFCGPTTKVSWYKILHMYMATLSTSYGTWYKILLEILCF